MSNQGPTHEVKLERRTLTSLVTEYRKWREMLVVRLKFELEKAENANNEGQAEAILLLMKELGLV